MSTIALFQTERDGAGKKSHVTRKHVIIGVTCALISAMVIAGVLVGVKFFLDSTHQIVQVSRRNNTLFSVPKVFSAV